MLGNEMKNGYKFSKIFKYLVGCLVLMVGFLFILCQETVVKAENNYIEYRQSDAYMAQKDNELWRSTIYYDLYKGKYDTYHKNGYISIQKVGTKVHASTGHYYNNLTLSATNANYITISLELVLPAAKEVSGWDNTPGVKKIQVKDTLVTSDGKEECLRSLVGGTCDSGVEWHGGDVEGKDYTIDSNATDDYTCTNLNESYYKFSCRRAYDITLTFYNFASSFENGEHIIYISFEYNDEDYFSSSDDPWPAKEARPTNSVYISQEFDNIVPTASMQFSETIGENYSGNAGNRTCLSTSDYCVENIHVDYKISEDIWNNEHYCVAESSTVDTTCKSAPLQIKAVKGEYEFVGKRSTDVSTDSIISIPKEVVITLDDSVLVYIKNFHDTAGNSYCDEEKEYCPLNDEKGNQIRIYISNQPMDADLIYWYGISKNYSGEYDSIIYPESPQTLRAIEIAPSSNVAYVNEYYTLDIYKLDVGNGDITMASGITCDKLSCHMEWAASDQKGKTDMPWGEFRYLLHYTIRGSQGDDINLMHLYVIIDTRPVTKKEDDIYTSDVVTGYIALPDIVENYFVDDNTVEKVLDNCTEDNKGVYECSQIETNINSIPGIDDIDDFRYYAFDEKDKRYYVLSTENIIPIGAPVGGTGEYTLKAIDRSGNEATIDIYFDDREMNYNLDFFAKNSNSYLVKNVEHGEYIASYFVNIKLATTKFGISLIITIENKESIRMDVDKVLINGIEQNNFDCSSISAGVKKDCSMEVYSTVDKEADYVLELRFSNDYGKSASSTINLKGYKSDNGPLSKRELVPVNTLLNDASKITIASTNNSASSFENSYCSEGKKWESCLNPNWQFNKTGSTATITMYMSYSDFLNSKITTVKLMSPFKYFNSNDYQVIVGELNVSDLNKKDINEITVTMKNELLKDDTLEYKISIIFVDLAKLKIQNDGMSVKMSESDNLYVNLNVTCKNSSDSDCKSFDVNYGDAKNIGLGENFPLTPVKVCEYLPILAIGNSSNPNYEASSCLSIGNNVTTITLTALKNSFVDNYYKFNVIIDLSGLLASKDKTNGYKTIEISPSKGIYLYNSSISLIPIYYPKDYAYNLTNLISSGEITEVELSNGSSIDAKHYYYNAEVHHSSDASGEYQYVAFRINESLKAKSIKYTGDKGYSVSLLPGSSTTVIVKLPKNNANNFDIDFDIVFEENELVVTTQAGGEISIDTSSAFHYVVDNDDPNKENPISELIKFPDDSNSGTFAEGYNLSLNITLDDKSGIYYTEQTGSTITADMILSYCKDIITFVDKNDVKWNPTSCLLDTDNSIGTKAVIKVNFTLPTITSSSNTINKIKIGSVMDGAYNSSEVEIALDYKIVKKIEITKIDFEKKTYDNGIWYIRADNVVYLTLDNDYSSSYMDVSAVNITYYIGAQEKIINGTNIQVTNTGVSFNINLKTELEMDVDTYVSAGLENFVYNSSIQASSYDDTTTKYRIISEANSKDFELVTTSTAEKLYINSTSGFGLTLESYKTKVADMTLKYAESSEADYKKLSNACKVEVEVTNEFSLIKVSECKGDFIISSIKAEITDTLGLEVEVYAVRHPVLVYYDVTYISSTKDGTVTDGEKSYTITDNQFVDSEKGLTYTFTSRGGNLVSSTVDNARYITKIKDNGDGTHQLKLIEESSFEYKIDNTNPSITDISISRDNSSYTNDSLYYIINSKEQYVYYRVTFDEIIDNVCINEKPLDLSYTNLLTYISCEFDEDTSSVITLTFKLPTRSFSGEKEANVSFRAEDLAGNSSENISIDRLWMKYTNTISMRVDEYTVITNGCIYQSRFSRYHCILKNNTESSINTMMFEVKFEGEDINYIETPNTGNFALEYQSLAGNTLIQYATSVEKVGASLYHVVFNFDSNKDNVLFSEARFVLLNLRDTAGGILNTRKELKGDEIYVHGDINGLASYISDENLMCETNDKDCDKEYAKKELIKDAKELEDYEYTINIDGVDPTFENGIIERTLTITITRVDNESYTTTRTLELKKLVLSINLDSSSLTSEYGKQKNIGVSFYSQYSGSFNLKFKIDGIDVEDAQYLPVNEDGYDIVVEDTTGCYDVIILNNPKYIVTPANIIIDDDDSKNVKYYLDKELTKELTDNSIYKEYDGTDTYTNLVYMVIEDYFKGGADKSVKLSSSVSFGRVVDSGYNMDLSTLPNTYRSLDSNYKIDKDDSDSFTIEKAGAIYAKKLSLQDMSSVINKYEDGTETVYYANDATPFRTSEGYTITLPSSTSIKYDFNKEYSINMYYIDSTGSGFEFREKGTYSIMNISNVCYKINDAVCVMNGVVYDIASNSKVFNDFGYDETRLFILPFTVSNTNNYIIGDVVGLIKEDTEAPTIETFTAETPTHTVENSYYGTTTIKFTAEVKDNNTNVTPSVCFYKVLSEGYGETIVIDGITYGFNNSCLINGSGKDYSISSSGSYLVIVKDAVGNEVGKNFYVSINTNPSNPNIEQVIFDVTGNNANGEGNYVYTEGDDYTIYLDFGSANPIKTYEVSDFVVKAKDEGGNEYDLSSTPICSSSTSYRLKCTGQIVNYDQLNTVVTISKVVAIVYATSYYNKETTISLDRAIEYVYKNSSVEEFSNSIQVNFAVAGIKEIDMSLGYGTNFEASIADKKYYPNINSVTITFTFTDSDFEVKSIDVRLVATDINLSARKINVAAFDADNCSLSSDSYQCFTDETISVQTQGIYILTLEGNLVYTSNGKEITKEVQSITIHDEKFAELYLDNLEFTPSISLSSTNRTATSATYEISCNKQSIKNCTLTDFAKVLLKNSEGDLITNVNNVTINNDNTFVISGLGDGTYTIQLDRGAIIDVAGNWSNVSNVENLDNSMIEVTDAINTSITQASGVANEVFNVSIYFNKNVRFSVGSVKVEYKYVINGSVQEPELRDKVVTGLSANEYVNVIQVPFNVTSGDNGNLVIVSIIAYPGVNATISDETNFAVSKIDCNLEVNNALADTTAPSLTDGLVVKYNDEIVNSEISLNDDSIKNNGLVVEIHFNENLGYNTGKLVDTREGINMLSIDTNNDNISGSMILITLNPKLFAIEGKLMVSYNYTVEDIYGNSVINTIELLDTKVTYDNTAPEITVNKNVYLNTTIDSYNLSYSVNEGSYNSLLSITANSSVVRSAQIEEEGTIAISIDKDSEGLIGEHIITIPSGLYKDAAGNESEAIDITIKIGEENYVLKPANYDNNEYYDAIAMEGYYYIKDTSTYYFKVAETSDEILITEEGRAAGFTLSGRIIAYTPDEETTSVTIPANTFTVDNIPNIEKTFNYSVVTVTNPSRVVTTTDNKTYLKANDVITVVINLGTYVDSTVAKKIRLTLNIGTNLRPMKLDTDSIDSKELVNTLTYTYSIKSGDNESISINEFSCFDITGDEVYLKDDELGLTAETRIFTPELTLLSEGRTDTNAKYSLDCGKNNVNCNVTDVNKVTVYKNENVDNSVVISSSNNIITLTNLSEGSYSISLASGAIVDYAGNPSEKSEDVTLDNTLISIESVETNTTDDVVKGDGEKVSITIVLNKDVTISGNLTIYYTYGEGEPNNVTKRYLNAGQLVQYIDVDLLIATGDNGPLSNIRIVTSTGYAIEDSTHYSVNELTYNLTDSNIKADTTPAELSSFEIIYGNKTTYEDEGIYYLNNFDGMSIYVKFNKLLSKGKVTITTSLGTLSSEDIYTDDSDPGNKVSYVSFDLSNVSFVKNGALTIEKVGVKVVDKYNNSLDTEITASDDANSIVKASTNIIYDNIAPTINADSIQMIGTNKGNTETVFEYQYTYTDTNSISNENTITDTITYSASGEYKLVILANSVVDKAGNGNARVQSSITIYVSSDAPIISILDIKYKDSDNNVYYDGIHTNTITLSNGSTCTLTSSEYEYIGCEYISIENEYLVIKAGIYTNSYGLSNAKTTTGYKLVDYSRLDFTTTITSSTAIAKENATRVYLVSQNLSTTYTIVFSSTRNLDVSKTSGLSKKSNSSYEYTFDRNINTNKEIIVKDYLGNENTVFSIEFDSVAPEITFDNSTYVFNTEQVTSRVEIKYTVSDGSRVKEPTISNRATISVVTCSDDATSNCLSIGNLSTGTYTITIPVGFYEDTIRNQSSKETLTIIVGQSANLIPLTNKDGTLVNAKSTTEEGVTTYHVASLSEIKFEVKSAKSVIAESVVSEDSNMNCEYDSSLKKWICTYNNTNAYSTITIASGALKIDDVDISEMTFNFEVHSVDELDSGLTITSNSGSYTIGNTINIEFKFENTISLLDISPVPSLTVTIGTKDVVFNGSVSNNVITYSHLINGDTPEGTLSLKSIDTTNKIYDYAYNALNAKINDIISKDTSTGIVVDKTPIDEPTLTVSAVKGSCIASIQNEATYYYCDSSNLSTDKINVTVNVDESETIKTSTLALKVNGSVVASEIKNSLNYEISVGGFDNNVATTITITLAGSLFDTANNETVVNVTNEQFKYINGGYKIRLVREDSSINIYSHSTNPPSFIVENNIGVYDDLLGALNYNGKYSLMCNGVECNKITGLTKLILKVEKLDTGTALRVSVYEEISSTIPINTPAEVVLKDVNNGKIAIGGVSNEQSINVELVDTTFTYNNATPTIKEETVSVSDGRELFFNNKYFINENAIIEINVEFDQEVYQYDQTISLYIGAKDNSTKEKISFSIEPNSATITDNDYIITINNDTVKYIYNKYIKTQELEIELINVTNINMVTANIVLDTILNIDVEKPTIVFNEKTDNISHKIGDIVVNDTQSGVASVTYYVDGEPVVLEDGKIDLSKGIYSHGNHTITVNVVDNMDKSNSDEITIFVDKEAPKIELLSLEYTADKFEATYKVSDDNTFDEIKYCVNNTKSCVNVKSYSPVLDDYGKFVIKYEFIEGYDIDYKNFNIVFESIEDEFDNVTNHVDTGLDPEPIYTITDRIRLSSKDNCGEKNDDCYSYKLDLNYTILKIEGLPEQLKRSNIVPGSSKITLYSRNDNLENPNFIVTVSDGIKQATYKVEFTDFKINVDTFDPNDITITLDEGTNINPFSYDDEEDLIASIVKRDENLTSCSANKECIIEFNVKEYSGWTYEITKKLEVADVVVPTISGYGLSDDVINIEGLEYRVIYTDKDYDGEYTLTIDHGSNSNIVLPILTSIDLHTKYAFTYGYYDESKVLNQVTYRFYRVNLNVTDDISIDTIEYKNVHYLDITELFGKDYDVNYEISFYNKTMSIYIYKGDNDTYKVDYKGDINQVNYISYDNTTKKIKCAIDSGVTGEYTIKLSLSLLNSNVEDTEIEFADIKFDDMSSEIASVVDNVTWAQEKEITINIVCNRLDDSCVYYDSESKELTFDEINNKHVYTTSVNANDTYAYSFTDDAGNTYVINVEVSNIDTTEPSIDGVSYIACQNIDGLEYIYCSNPTITIIASDDASGVKEYKFGYKIIGEDNINYDEEFMTSNSKNFKDVFVDSSKVYQIYVIVKDNAGNEFGKLVLDNIVYSVANVTFDVVATPDTAINKIGVPNATSSIEGIVIVSKAICINDECFDINSDNVDFKEDSFKVEEDLANARVKFKAIDSLGNVGYSNEITVNIDITNPRLDGNRIEYTEIVYKNNNNIYYINETSDIREGMFIIPVSEQLEGKNLKIITEGSGDEKTAKSSKICVQFEKYAKVCTDYDVVYKEQTIKIKAIDDAGNESNEISVDLKIDSLKPFVANGSHPFDESRISKDYSKLSNGIYIIYVTQTYLTIDLENIIDEDSGIKRVCLFNQDNVDLDACRKSTIEPYNLNGESDDTSYITIYSSGNWYVHAIDNVGNELIIQYELINVSAGVDFALTKDVSNGQFTYKDVNLTIKVVDSNYLDDISSITWQLDGNEVTSCAKKKECSVSENGTYTASITSRYGITITKEITVDNIDTSMIFDVNDNVTIIEEESVVYINGTTNYFAGDIKFSIPKIKLNEKLNADLKLYGYYGINLFKDEEANKVISETSFATSKFNSEDNTYTVFMNKLEGLVNGCVVTIRLLFVAVNGRSVEVKFDLIYVDESNFTIEVPSGYNVNYDNGANTGKVSNNGKYQKVIFGVMTINSALPELTNTTKEHSYVVSKDNYSVGSELTTEGSYVVTGVKFVDACGVTRTIDISNIKFTIDRSSDSISINGSSVDTIDSLNDNPNVVTSKDKATLTYTLYIESDGTKKVGVTVSSAHTVRILDLDNQNVEITLIDEDDYSEFTFVYPIIEISDEGGNITKKHGFRFEVIDEAENVSYNKDAIASDSFVNTPSVSYNIDVNQEEDGEIARLIAKARYNNINTNNLTYHGIVECEETCMATNVLEDLKENRTKINYNSNDIGESIDVTNYAGKTIIVVLEYQVKVDNNTTVVHNVSLVVDLTNYPNDLIAAPSINFELESLVTKNLTPTIKFTSSNDVTILVQYVDKGHSEFKNSEGFIALMNGNDGSLMQTIQNPTSETITLNSLKEGGYMIFAFSYKEIEDSYGQPAIIYSSLASMRLDIDASAPIVIDYGSNNLLDSGKPTIVNSSVKIRLEDEHSRGSNITYTLTNGNNNGVETDYNKNTNFIEIAEDGKNVLTVCDSGVVEGNNCKEYIINIDSALPNIKLMKDAIELNPSDNSRKYYYGYNIKTGKVTIPLFDTILNINDMSLKSVSLTTTFTGASMTLNYDVYNKIFTDAQNTTMTLEYIEKNGVKTVELIDDMGTFREYKLNFQNGVYTVADYDEIQFTRDDGSNILRPLIIPDENNNYRIPLRMFFTLVVMNANSRYDLGYKLEDITSLELTAKDARNSGSSTTKYLFDLMNPVIDVIPEIEDNDIREYLSRDGYIWLYRDDSKGYIFEEYASHRLVSCNSNNKVAVQECKDNNNNYGLYLQVISGDNADVKSSKAIIEILKNILRIDGTNSYSSLPKSDQDGELPRLRIYYGGLDRGLDGDYIENYRDDDYALNQLTRLGKHDLLIEYTDALNNSSVFHISLFVEDTIAPTISGGGSTDRDISITDNIQGAKADFSSLEASDAYSPRDKIKCVFTILNISETEYDCSVTNGGDIIVGDVKYGRYEIEINESGAIDAIYVFFNIKGNYSVTFKFTDENNNISTKEFKVKVTDKTRVDVTITDNTEDNIEISVEETTSKITIQIKNNFNIGSSNSIDINLSSIANIVLSEVNETSTYDMEHSATFVSALLGRNSISLSGINEVFKSDRSVNFSELGTYSITYKVKNDSEQEVQIEYVFTVVDTQAPTLDILVNGNKVDDDYKHIVKVGEDSSLTVTQLRDEYLTRVTVSASDNHTLDEKLVYTGPTCSSKTSGLSGNVLAQYTCTFTVKDASNNSTSKTITIEIIDDIKPVIQGIEDKTIYVNTTSVQLEIPACSDNNKNKECTVYYSIDGGTATKYSGVKSIKLNDGNRVYVIEIYAIDGANNETENRYIYTYHLDTIVPTLDIIKTKGDLADYGICGIVGNEDTCVIDNQSVGYILNKNSYTQIHVEGADDNLSTMTISKYNGTSFDVLSTSLGNISETGLYRVEISDLSGNVASKEFYVYKEIYVENSETKKIDVLVTSGDASEKVSLEYRELYLVEYNTSRESIKRNDEVFSKITKTDGVYVIGVNTNQEYVSLIKYNGSDLYNTITDIKANAVGVRESLIEIEGKYYLIMALSDNNEDLGNNEVIDQGDGNQSGGNSGGSSFTWIFYVLGVIGVLGGGFLIMKLRKKVRAA